MRTKGLTLLGLAPLAWLFAFASPALAEDTRILITDPVVLQSMGFPPDATNVYRRVSSPGRFATDAEANDFGTGAQFTGIAAKSFVGRQNTAATPWQYDGGAVGCCVNLRRTGPELFADAPLNLPNGVLLDFIRTWAHDADAAGDLDVFIFETCYPPFGGGATTITDLGTASTTGSTGYQSTLINLNTTINNRDCSYTVRVRFDTTNLTLQKIRAQWVRQISPAPVAASFNDVPTSSSFFQVIEALAASGITTGCTATDFCPNSPVTRAQMAAFLARALGL